MDHKRPDIDDLSYRHLEDKPSDIDWTERHDWQSWESETCEDCDTVVAVSPGDDCPECGAEHWAEGPMMNYYYPCTIEDPAEAALVLDGLPLCTVEFEDGKTALALTGGGMDLTWEICEAYMRLGYVPPMHYASDLPAMAGRGGDATDRWIIAGCRKALEAALERAQRAVRRLEDQATAWEDR